jgi:hypothetical protein
MSLSVVGAPRCSNRSAVRFALLAALVGLEMRSALATNLRMEASTAWAENINRASSPGDWRDSARLDASLSLVHLTEWRTGLVSVVEGGASAERITRFTQQDAATAGGSLQVRRKFGFGPHAPVLSFDASLRGREARIDGNDGWTAGAGVRVTKRFTTWFRAGLTADWQEHDARSAVFDTQHHRVFGTLAWQIAPRLSLTHGNGRLWGSFTANASSAVWSRALGGGLGRPIADYYHTVPRSVTESYGPGWVTYRVDGHVSFWWLELSAALGPNTSLPLRYESFFSVNRVGVKYRQDVWTLQLIHRY